jgi:Family of unknown function (DUF6580)
MRLDLSFSQRSCGAVNQNRQQTVQDLLVFILLVAIGVAGRLGQPEWCFTPTAAAAIFAGYYFPRAWIAVLVPLAILATSDLLLPAHDSIPVMFATYAVMTIPVWFGRMMANSRHSRSSAWRWALCGLLPATLFWVVTNFAVWAFQSDYPKTLAGLAACYWAAVPFFRWMLAGDLFYLAILLSCLALAGAGQRQALPAPVRESEKK